MPTGYTATLMEKGQTFPEFIMTCARAFGALIELRDELDTPIPDELPKSTFASKRLAELREQLSKLEGMSNAAIQQYGKKLRSDAISHAKSYAAKEKAENARLEIMEAHVLAWTPPSKDHEELKAFMLRQIHVSKHSTQFYSNTLSEATASTSLDHYNKKIAEVRSSIQYFTKQEIDDSSRNRQRNEWLSKLRSSIKK